MKTFERTVTTDKVFEDAVSATERKAGEKGFRVLHTQDVMRITTMTGPQDDPICEVRRVP